LKTVRSIIPAIFLLLVSGIVSNGCGDSPRANYASLERFILLDINGQERRWSEFKGKPLMINFWATWCGPCRREIPLLINIYDQYHDQGLEIIGISIDQRRDQVPPFVRQFDIPYVILYGDYQSTVEFELGRGIPVTIFIDAEGNETGRISGAQPPEFFMNQVQKLMATKPAQDM